MGSGAAAGFIYDLFRLKRKALKTKAFLIGLEDIIFWVLTALLVFTAAYFSNEGEVRLHFIFGALLGVIIYYWMFSHWVVEILTFLVKAVLWPFAFLIKVLKPPVRWVGRQIGEEISKTGKKLHMSQIKFQRRFKSIRHIQRKI